MVVWFFSDMLKGLVIVTKPYSYDRTLTSFAVKFIDFPLDLTWQIDKPGRFSGRAFILWRPPAAWGRKSVMASEMCQVQP